MISLIIWIVVGGIAGWIASILVKTNDQRGCLTNVIVGMVGSLVGGTVVVFLNTGKLDLFNTAYNNLDLISILVSVLGAVIFLLILKVLKS